MSDSSHVINQTAIDAAATVFRSMADELFTSSADVGLVTPLDYLGCQRTALTLDCRQL